uniref:Putative secreted protein salivary gland overexpressed n=1 Tax=Rhipicephalus microplus TaxID=6941 RepID=A0A6M2D9B8_RHIMP
MLFLSIVFLFFSVFLPPHYQFSNSFLSTSSSARTGHRLQWVLLSASRFADLSSRYTKLDERKAPYQQFQMAGASISTETLQSSSETSSTAGPRKEPRLT